LECELRREEQGSVAADRNDEICLPPKLRDGLSHESIRKSIDRCLAVEEDRESARAQMRREGRHGVGDPGVFNLADEGDSRKVLVHSSSRLFSMRSSAGPQSLTL